jgi:hypothetical protein
MILEGIVTTVSEQGVVNIAPMGPEVDSDRDPAALRTFVLKPFRTARTYVNLKAHPEGVLHVSDDVLLLARAAIGTVEPLPPLEPARAVRGWVLPDAVRFFEFRVVVWDDSSERTRLTAEVLHVGRGRDWFGFNRARHAVVEAAILATRIGLLPREQIEEEFRRLAPLVTKTGGPREHEAFELLQQHIRAFEGMRDEG